MKKFLLSLVALLTTVASWAQNVATTITPGNVYTLECRSDAAHKTTRFIGDNGTVIDGRSAQPTYLMFEAGETDGTYYIKSLVSNKYINSDGNKVVASETPSTAWILNAGGKDKVANQVCFSCGNDKYLNNNGTKSDGTCTNLQPNSHSGGPAEGNACSLWEMKEYDASVATIKGQLETLLAEAKTYKGGEGLGEYSLASIASLQIAIEVAQAKVDANNVVEADIKTLQNAIDALTKNLPSVGGFYTLQSASTNPYCKDSYVFTYAIPTSHTGNGLTGTKNHQYLVFGTIENVSKTPAAIFQVKEGSKDGMFKLMNVQTQEFVKSFGKNAVHMGSEAEAKNIDINTLGEGQITLTVDGESNPMHAQHDYAVIVSWAAALNNASAWYMEKIEDFSHTLTIGEAGWSTLILGYNTMIPENVACYVVSEVTETSAKLEQVTGVLPANVAVVVNATPGNYEFAYTTNEATLESKLEGTLFTTNVTPEEGITCYVLSNPANVLGFYQAALTDGHFQNNANKVYLPVANTTSQVLKFNFGTTGIEGVETDNNSAKSVIYDLSGRRVNATSKGIYIQNGKKFIVK